MQGTIKSVRLDGRFGFIKPHGFHPRGELFFHATDLRGIDFDEQLIERDVLFELGKRDGRQRALNVRSI